jgi:hypothetical protein
MTVAALWYLSYGPGGQGPVTSAAAWNPQHLVFAGLAVGLFAALRLRPMLKIAVAVGCLALVASVYALEIALASANWGFIARSTPVWNLDQSSPERARELALARAGGVQIDTRRPAEVLTDLRARQIDAVPAVMLADVLRAPRTGRSDDTAELGTLLPIGAISNTLTVLCNESGEFVSYRSDEHGFRNPAGEWRSAHADLAAVGQSLTQGYCVPDGKGYVDLLRAPNRITLNLGTSGQSVLLQLAAIREYLSRYRPEVVLWFFTEGIDLSDLYEESTHPEVMRYLEPDFSQRLLDRQPEIDRGLRHLVARQEARARDVKMAGRKSAKLDQLLGMLKLWDLREKIELLYGFQSDAQPWSIAQPSIRGLLSEALLQAQHVVQQWDGALYFVYLPSWERFRNGPRVSEREHATVLKLVAGLGVPVIDVQPAFQSHPDPLSLFPYRRFGHYNEAGNRIVADTILTFLSRHQPLQSSADRPSIPH